MSREFRTRSTAAIKAALTDALIVYNIENSGQPETKYLSGFSGTSSVLIIGRNFRYIITDSRYFGRVKYEAPDFKLLKLSTQKTTDLVQEIFKKHRVKTLAVDGRRTFYSQVRKLENATAIKIKDKENLVTEIRAVKTREEIRNIEKAADIAMFAFKKLLKYIKPGLTEKMVAAKLEAEMRLLGSERPAFETIIASGKNAAQPHWQTSDKKLKKGELVIIDFGATYHGYVSDITRTVAVGTISSTLQSIYNTVREAHAVGLKKAGPKLKASALDKACRDYIAAKGYGEQFFHSTGHGIGLEVHESPNISAVNHTHLQAGNVITCEPGIYIAGLGGVRIEDDLLITETGNRNLTAGLTHELITI